jgi:hypothetical protein
VRSEQKQNSQTGVRRGQFLIHHFTTNNKLSLTPVLFSPPKIEKKVFLPAVCERAGGGAGTMSVQEKQGRVSRNREHEDEKVQQQKEEGR